MDLLGIGTIGKAVSDIVGHFFGDKTKQEQDAAAFQLQQLLMQTDLVKGQLAINQAEADAAKGGLGRFGAFFVAGWRPAVGWACALSFTYNYIGAPFIVVIAQWAGHPVKLPTLDFAAMSPILSGMLGLGFARTVEKVKGVTKNA